MSTTSIVRGSPCYLVRGLLLANPGEPFATYADTITQYQSMLTFASGYDFTTNPPGRSSLIPWGSYYSAFYDNYPSTSIISTTLYTDIDAVYDGTFPVGAYYDTFPNPPALNCSFCSLSTLTDFDGQNYLRWIIFVGQVTLFCGASYKMVSADWQAVPQTGPSWTVSGCANNTASGAPGGTLITIPLPGDASTIPSSLVPNDDDSANGGAYAGVWNALCLGAC